MNKIAACIGGFCIVLLSLVLIVEKPQPELIQKVPPPIPVQPVPQFPAKPNLTNSFPGYQDYSAIQNQLEQWKQQSPNLVETGTYGTSTRGVKLSYIRITNLLDPSPKKKVLITACIHGNEPLATSTTMGFIGTMLSNYTVDNEVTDLINTRDIYFVPVVSPDSYPNSRHVDGVDPNRNFPSGPGDSKRSVKPLDDLQKWFLQIKFNAAISGHTFGRVYLIPYGDRTELCPNNEDYVRIIGKMQGMSQYRRQRACEMYSRPIFGSEVDWYYRNGAFAIVCEYGTHQRIPTMSDTKAEFDMTYKATLVFIREAPLVKPQQTSITFTDLNKGTRLFSPTTTINVLDSINIDQLRMMRVSTTNNVTFDRPSKFDRFGFDLFRASEIDLAAILRHPSDIVRCVYPLEK